MKESLQLFEERHNQATDFPVHAQPPEWRSWDGRIIESNLTKKGHLANIPVGQLFRFDENRPDEGDVRHVGRVTNEGIWVVMRDSQGLRTFTSQPVMSRAMRETSSDPSADITEHILTNY